MSDGILRVTQEIEIKDYASILFYDWHLYCLDADIKRWKEEEEALRAAAAVFEEATDNQAK